MRTTHFSATAPDGTVRSVRCDLPIWISASGSTPIGSRAGALDSNRVLLLPIEPSGDACAVALIPDACESVALRNGMRLRCGLNVLRHGDRLTVEGRAVWVSIVAVPDEVICDPGLHGDPVYCRRTKARIAPGDPIVICAGTAERACGMPYSAVAWAAGIACHECGAEPGRKMWVPPESVASGSLEALVRRAAEG